MFRYSASGESARATCPVTTEDKLTELAKENTLITQKNRNADFVKIAVKKALCEKLEEKSRQAGANTGQAHV